MRYNILLLALLLHNACHSCLSTTTTTATHSQSAAHADKPIAVHNNNDTNNNNNNNITTTDETGRGEHNGYHSKIGGHQTASPTATSSKLKQKHASHPKIAGVTYMTTSSRSSSTTATAKGAAATKTTPVAVTATARTKATTAATQQQYGVGVSSTASAAMQPAFAYKAAVPMHEEKQVAAVPTTAALPANSATFSYNDDNNSGDSERDGGTDGASSKKIIGSSVVTSVSVILHDNEPAYTDALGHKVPKPQPSLQVASPIDLLNPDRYEFYTFDDNGELVKRLMTMQEIQSIVANGDGEGPAIIHTAPIDERDPEKNVQDIVNSVQTVLNTQVETNKHNTTETIPVLDTPDVSSSWSMILPAIFGNTGGSIFPPHKPLQINMTPDTELLEATTKSPTTTRTTKKPGKRKPGQKRKTTTSTTTTEMTPQIVQEDLAPHETVYTGMEQYQHIASNIQDFNLKPLYQQIPELSTKVETTTRRVFVNNQEIVQTASTTTGRPDLDAHLAKKPIGVHNKRPGLHSHKTPNDGVVTHSSTKRPQVTHTKQKIKKRPTSTTALPTPVAEISTTSTELPASPSPPLTTVQPAPSIATTQKKKKKKPTRQPGTHPVHSTSTAHDEQSTHYTKPHAHTEKRKPTQRPTTAHQKPRPTDTTLQHNKHTISQSPAVVTPTAPHTTVNKVNHHKRPRPKPQKTTTKATAAPVVTSANDELIVQQYPGLNAEMPVTPSAINQLKHELAALSTTTKRPVAYPIPAYEIQKPMLPIADSAEDQYTQPKPLPSLSQLQQQQYTDTAPAAAAASPLEDIHTLMSYDQLMQSLKGDDGIKSGIEVQDMEINTPGPLASASTIVPTKYDSAETVEKLEEMAQKKKKPVTNNMITGAIATTMLPLTANYGGSTLATVLAGEVEANTGRPVISDSSSTESASTEESSTIPNEEDDNAPIVLITQRPVFFATTRKPDDIKTTYMPNTDETVMPMYTEPPATTELDLTAQGGYTQQMQMTSKTTPRPSSDQSQVVHFEPHYVEEPEPVITELTTLAPPTEATTITTNLYGDSEETTLQLEADKLEAYIDETTSTESAESESAYTTPELLRLPVSVPQKVEHLISGDDGSTEVPPSVANMNQHLNPAVLRPTDQILMGDFQTQAATVASTLVDGTNTMAAETFMSSNETKDELQFLMSDVIQQMTTQDEQYKLTPPETNANRLTNYAQLNTSFLMKPAATMDQGGSSTSNTQNGYTVAMDETSAPDAMYQSTLYETTTELPQLETTTLIPSREELIKIEAEYLSSIKELEQQVATTDRPEFEEVETTTYRIPMLSLSQIYAQQQQKEDEMESAYESEKATTETSAMNTDKSEELMDYATTEQTTHYEMDNQTNPPDTSMDSNESNDSNNIKVESHEVMTPQTEKLSAEVNSAEQNYATMINAAEKSKEEQAQYASTSNESAELALPSKETTDKETSSNYAPMINEPINSVEKQSLEQIYATMINSENPPDLVASQEAEDIYTNAQSQVVDQTQASPEKQTTSSVEDNTTSAALHEPQYTNESVSKESNEKETNTDSVDSTEQPSQYGLIMLEPESIELSLANDTASKADESTEEPATTEPPQYIETTPAYTMNIETSEEMLDELIATMYDQTGLEETAEDAYVKLGESTAKPNEPTETQSSTQNEAEKLSISTEPAQPTKLQYPTPALTPMSPAVESAVSQESQLQQQMSTLSAMPMPAMSYGQQLNEEDEEEDVNAQMASGYQIPNFSASTTTTTTPKPITMPTKRLNTLKPVSYYKQPAFGNYNQAEPTKVLTYAANSPQQRPMQRPAALSNLMATSTQATRPPVKLEASPAHSKGLEASIANLDEDVLAFARLCNELAFSYWKSITSEKISSARSLVLSPFALTSMLSMVFLGARGGTSGEMNEVLKLDDMVTFNPHLVFKNITESVEKSIDSDIATVAFVREIFSDRNNGKILQFFKEKTQQFYAGHVEEVNFHVVNDIIRRRTNLLIKRHTMGKVLEYLRTNSVWVNGPLATISANLFQTDCSQASTHERDGEMFFQVHPTVRQRRLVPIPAVLYKRGFTAGYEPRLDATVVAFGRIQDTVSTIYVMPGHQSSIAPTDNLDRLQDDLIELAFKENAWSNLLTSLMDRPGMEVQLPRFSHRSFVNASLGLQKMGLKGLFKSDYADLRGLTGSSNRDIFLSDMIQINTFSTCGEERISDHHHVEMYPAPPLRKRNKDVDAREDDEFDSSEAIIDFGSLVQDPTLGRGFYDDLLDPKYLELPLPLRPRQARVPDAPRLRFDKPFLYFVRHNPTGVILFMGRFNPRLLP